MHALLQVGSGAALKCGTVQLPPHETLSSAELGLGAEGIRRLVKPPAAVCAASTDETASLLRLTAAIASVACSFQRCMYHQYRSGHA